MKLNIIRHIVQCLIVLLFLSPIWAEAFLGILPGDWFFFGTLSSSTILGQVVVVDPFSALESIAASKQFPTMTLLTGSLIVLLVYGLIRGRAFCGWACPVNLILEIVEFFARHIRALAHGKTPARHNEVTAKTDGTRNQNTSETAKDMGRSWIMALSRRTKIYVALGVLILSALCGIPVFELVSPIGAVFRGLVLGAYLGVWVLLALVIFEIFFPGRLWCSKLCPLGGFYQFIGRFGFLSIKMKKGCISCDACKHVCIANPSILDPVIQGTDEVVRSGDCMLCGKCIPACPKDLLNVRPCLPLRHTTPERNNK